ncbi:MAG: TlyA family RNA methyltransferase [Eubacteriales bacterium]
MERLDMYLYQKGYFDSREKAKRMIMAGNVFINGIMKDKPGEKIKEITSVEIKHRALYVGRGGQKLEKAFQVFNFSVKDRIAMDIGASTGGFTDCMLHSGAKKVYAIDVGYGQLDWRLRQDPRVICFERKNFRNMCFEEIGEKIQRFTMDVSFISIIKLLDNVKMFLVAMGEGVVLIKPQFEAGKDKVGKNGVIRDPKVHKNVLMNTLYKIEEKGFRIIDLDFSPIKGNKGNIEYLCHLCAEDGVVMGINKMEEMIDIVVKNANDQL